MSAYLILKISMNFTKALIETMSMVEKGAILVVFCKFLKYLDRLELGFDALTIFKSWVHFDFVILLHLYNCG